MILQKLRDRWDVLKARYGETRVNSLAIILLIGVASIAVRILIEYDFDSTALLYVGTPYLISLAIVLVKPVSKRDKWWHQYRDHSLMALTVFLASSVVLFEGFVCVLFFLPIYFLVVSIAFFFSWVSASKKRRNGTTLVSIVPVLLIATALEGTSASLSATRDSHVTVSKMAGLTPEAILENIGQPFGLQTERHWLLSIFPMPYEIAAGTLNPGDVHVVRTRYHRWFVTNTHEGELHLQIVEVSGNKVKTRFVHDTTFFSSYLTPVGTEITLAEITPGSTKITLRIDYQRKLDPAWYFHPLQQYGISKMADFLIDEVMIRDN